jgi:hypothetical protein
MSPGQGEDTVMLRSSCQRNNVVHHFTFFSSGGLFGSLDASVEHRYQSVLRGMNDNWNNKMIKIYNNSIF